MRDTKALDKFLIQATNRTLDLQTQMERLMRMDLNAGNTVAGVAYELGKARGINLTIAGFLDQAMQEIDKLAKLDLAKIGGHK